MRIALIVRPLGGATTVALCVAKALASLRGGIRPTKVRCITLSDTTGPVLRAWKLDPVRVASLAAIEEAIRATPGAVSIIDSMSDVRTLAREGYLLAVNEERERLNQRPVEGIMPAGWQAINARVEEATWRAALDVKADLIEVWRQTKGYARDADAGLYEVEGVRTKGQVEGPAGIGLILQIVDGGLRSNGEIGERVLMIAADPSGQSNGASISLPEIRSGKDRLDVLARVRMLVGPVLKRNMDLSDREVSAWAAVPQIADEWPEAAAHAQAEEGKRLLEEVRVSLLDAGLIGQKREVATAREKIFVKAWSVTRMEALASLPAKAIESGMARFVNEVAKFKEDMQAVESLTQAPRESLSPAQRGINSIRYLFGRYRTSDAEQRRLLAEHAQVETLEALASLPDDIISAALETLTQELVTGSSKQPTS